MKVDCSASWETTASTGGQVRHLKVKRTNVAHRLPRGKRAPGTEINHFQKHQSLRKQQFLKIIILIFLIF
ncbi:hypothetical protein QUF49_06385 [Fictibacillus sp. b24]|uniref:hypothetical protein n=1 Tax=Fictibacillus sp. b24 TaxID=3055863 RepID=UPI0025A26342|nr:hypothetical protein [Fictibacillus sp. b24]MDM5315619.1 hypothetical protein [Fictibacillus sp. b24]